MNLIEVIIGRWKPDAGHREVEIVNEGYNGYILGEDYCQRYRVLNADLSIIRKSSCVYFDDKGLFYYENEEHPDNCQHGLIDCINEPDGSVCVKVYGTRDFGKMYVVEWVGIDPAI